MCTHQKWVYNPYSQKKFLVKCGHCPACLEEKALKRASRIKSEYSKDKIVLFVTLTYDRASCPFVSQSDVDARLDPLPIYREFSTRRSRVDRSDGVYYFDKRHYGQVKLAEIEHPNYDSLNEFSKIRHLKFRSRNIGICYFPDIQLFKKRLNINLRRKYNYYEKYKVFSCTEYGGETRRPHAHLLFHIRPCDETLFRAAISEAWPFASHRRTEKYIEIARDAANYTASYVNSGMHLHRFLSDNFQAKSSYSKDYGMSNKLFSLDSILSKVKRRDLSYLRGVGPKGKETYVNFSIPKYVINRYFPLFKGYSRLTDVEILDVLRMFIQPDKEYFLRDLVNCSKLPFYKANYYTYEDCDRIRTRLNNSYFKYCKLSNCEPCLASKEDYVHYFLDAWKVFRFTNLKLWYLDDSVSDVKYKYDNSYQLFDGSLISPVTKEFFDSSPGNYIKSPNDYPDVMSQSSLYEDIYNFRCKEKHVNNYVMAQNNYYF